MHKSIIAIAALLIAGLALPADARQAGKEGYTKVREVTIVPSECARFCQGAIIDWSNGQTQVRIDFESDAQVEDPNASAPEWGIEVYDRACGLRRGYPVYTAQAIDDPTYGVRIHEFPRPHLLERVPNGSIVVVHDGPTPTRHAQVAGFSGRHELACVNT